MRSTAALLSVYGGIDACVRAAVSSVHWAVHNAYSSNFFVSTQRAVRYNSFVRLELGSDNKN